jgi:hypothetical protein
MSPAQRDLRIAAIALAVLILTVEAAAAQGQPQPSETLKSESSGQQDPRSTGSVGRSNEPLSEKLDRTDGVIRPPVDIAPDMALRPPFPDPGTTLVIPPLGAPGGDRSVEPK